jgi:hypothetical protein
MKTVKPYVIQSLMEPLSQKSRYFEAFDEFVAENIVAANNVTCGCG